jgi:hypothetical protein
MGTQFQYTGMDQIFEIGYTLKIIASLSGRLLKVDGSERPTTLEARIIGEILML